MSSIEQEFSDRIISYLLSKESPHEIPIEFAEIINRKDVEIQQNQLKNKSFRLEANFWDLVSELVKYRVEKNSSAVENVDYTQGLSLKFNSCFPYLANFIDTDTEIGEIWRILVWIRENLMFFDLQKHNGAGKWTHTKLDLQRSQIPKVGFGTSLSSSAVTKSTVTSLDYDAVIRQGKKLDAADAVADEYFFKSFYHLILQRRDADAVDLCRETNNWTYLMILQGLNDYKDPIIDPPAEFEAVEEGIKLRYLWRRNCLSLSQHAAGHGVFAEAIFEYLGGGAAKNLALNAGSWELSLLVLCNGLLYKKIESYLTKVHKIEDANPLKLQEFVGIDSIEDVLGALTTLGGLEEPCQNNLRVLMGSLMMNQLNSTFIGYLSRDINRKILAGGNEQSYTDGDDYVTDMSTDEVIYADEDEDYEETEQELEEILQEDPNYDNPNSYLVRVLTHLAIYLDIVGFDVAQFKMALIRLYLKRLFKKGFYHLVPVYMAVFASEEDTKDALIMRRRICSYYLSKIIDPENRKHQIKSLISLGFNDVNDILVDTVDLVVSKYGSADISGTVNFVEKDPATEQDRVYYGSIDWLVNSNQKLNKVSLKYINEIFISLLFAGKITTAVEFFKSYDFKSILKKAEVESFVMKQLRSASYDVDVEISTTEDEDSDSSKGSDSDADSAILMNFLVLVSQGFVKIIEFEEFLEANGLKSKDQHVFDATKWQTRTIKEKLDQDFLQPLKSLIVDKLTTLSVSKNPEINEQFRRIYVPYFIIKLHKMFVESRFCDSMSMEGSGIRIVGDSFLKQAIDMSVVVANGFGFVKYFKETGKLKEYLKLIAECAAQAGEDVLYE